VLNNCVAKDNRIPPLGFTGGDDIEIAPVGATYPPERPGSNRLRNVDVATYSVPVASTSGALALTARLHFQVSSKEYIEFLRNQAIERGFEGENLMCEGGPGRPFEVGPQDLSRGAYLYGLWSNPAYGKSPPVLVRSASTVRCPSLKRTKHVLKSRRELHHNHLGAAATGCASFQQHSGETMLNQLHVAVLAALLVAPIAAPAVASEEAAAYRRHSSGRCGAANCASAGTAN
jgi:hypothetical protein